MICEYDSPIRFLLLLGRIEVDMLYGSGMVPSYD